jgi:hypothetical protein
VPEKKWSAAYGGAAAFSGQTLPKLKLFRAKPPYFLRLFQIPKPNFQKPYPMAGSEAKSVEEKKSLFSLVLLFSFLSFFYFIFDSVVFVFVCDLMLMLLVLFLVLRFDVGTW